MSLAGMWCPQCYKQTLKRCGMYRYKKNVRPKYCCTYCLATTAYPLKMQVDE